MNQYTAYNVALAITVFPTSCLLLRGSNLRRSLLYCARTALLMTVLGYPWDFFAIKLGAWGYPKAAGATLYGVPVNDLVFMWICTQLTCSVLIAARRWETCGQRHAKSEDTREEYAGHN
jgi:lycopene cyclase domain-containing protein